MGTESRRPIGKLTSAWPADVQRSWRTVGELLKTAQYEQAAELLHEWQVANKRTSGAVFTNALVAARQICVACSQCRSEADWHRKAYEETNRREAGLREHLHAILDLVSQCEAIETPLNSQGQPSAPTVEMNLPVRGLPEPVDRLSLWQRVRNLLVWGLVARSSGGESPPVAADAWNAASDEKAEIPAAAPAGRKGRRGKPSLGVHCLGTFRVHQDDELIADWPSGRGKAILKYMIAYRSRPISKDILMDIFWRDSSPESARNNLNVAICGLRKALKSQRTDFNHILCENGYYFLNPVMTVWVDFEEFMQRHETAYVLERQEKLAEAMSNYEVAASLYQGDFMEDDLYEDWPVLQRESLKDTYVTVLDRLSRYYMDEKRYMECIQYCEKVLAKDDWREDAHRRLMRCYSRLGQRNMALRQYEICMQVLRRELDVSPEKETVALYERIRAEESV